MKIGNDEGELEKSGENAFVGGENRWNYDTWTNWEVYPNEQLPILMYFKETQTKPEGQIVSVVSVFFFLFLDVRFSTTVVWVQQQQFGCLWTTSSGSCCSAGPG